MPQWLYTVFDIQDVLYKIAAAAAFIFFFPFVLVAITAVFDGFFKGI